MSWLDGSALIAGIVVLALAFIVSLALRRRNVTEPSALGMALLPISVLLVFVIGIVLVLHGVGMV
jgi:hypothetical protein